MVYTDDELKDLVKAGKIANLALKKVCEKVKPGVSIGALYDYAVKIIYKTGAELSFPPNISLDEIAAHDTAGIHEKRTVPHHSLVKIDLGANVNGMLSDTAKTVSVDGKYTRIIRAADEALNNAIKVIKPGISINTIGKTIQEAIESYDGLKPIANLTGHLIDKGSLHAGLSIPNVARKRFSSRAKIKAGMILAIEPFATNGDAGAIKNHTTPPLIYSVAKGANPKTEIGKALFKRYQYIPFSLRDGYAYLKKQHLPAKQMVRSLNQDYFNQYPPLIEMTSGVVAQSEHTVYVTNHGAKKIT